MTSGYGDAVMTTTHEPISALLRVLADETRLRILALLGQTELSVGEIARCLAMGQSRVSNHLKTLREAGLLGDRHQGSFTFSRLDVPNGRVGELWAALAPSLDTLEHGPADRRRLEEVLADRSESADFFDRIAGDWDVIGSDFAHGTGRLEALGCLVDPGLAVADVGCGTGYLARALGRRVKRVVGVDTSPAMLERARQNLADVAADVELRLGAVEQLPLADAEVDAACAHMVLHHLVDTRQGVREMARVVRPGGIVVCVDLLPHTEHWMAEAMADVRLGLQPSVIEADLTAAGLTDVSHELLHDSYVVENPNGRKVRLPLFLARGRRPLADGGTAG